MTIHLLLLLILVIYFCKDKSQLLHILLFFLFIIYLKQQYEGFGPLGFVTDLVLDNIDDLPLEELCDFASDMIVEVGCDGKDEPDHPPCHYRVLCDEYACKGEHIASLATATHTYIPSQNSQCSIGRYYFDEDWLETHPDCSNYINLEEECLDLGCILHKSDGMCVPDTVRLPKEASTWCGQFGTGNPEKPLEDCETYTENNPPEEICRLINKIDDNGNPDPVEQECVYIRRSKYKNNLCQDLMTTPDCSTFDQSTCDPDFCEWGPDPDVLPPSSNQEEAYTRALEEANTDAEEAQTLIDEANADSSPGYEQRTQTVITEQTPILDAANALIATLETSQENIDSKQTEIDAIVIDEALNTSCDCTTIDLASSDDPVECVAHCGNIQTQTTLQGELDTLISEQATLISYDPDTTIEDTQEICYPVIFPFDEMGKSNVFKQKCNSYEFDENITEGEEHKCEYRLDCSKDNPNQCQYKYDFIANDSECPITDETDETDERCYDPNDLDTSICSSSSTSS